jgi:hypothetical protein
MQDFLTLWWVQAFGVGAISSSDAKQLVDAFVTYKAINYYN